MHRTFIATVTALSLAISGFMAAPAHAGNKNDDLVKFLFGAATIAIIVNEHEKQRKKQKVYSTVRTPDRDRDHGRDRARDRARDNDRGRDHGRSTHRDTPRGHRDSKAARKELPGYCLRTNDGNRGVRKYFSAGCLQRNFQYTHRLPQQCTVNVRSNRGRTTGYGANCLRDYGYTIARR